MQTHRNTTATVRAVLKAAEDEGVAPAKLLEMAGIDPALAKDPDGEVTLETMRLFWQSAYAETKNPYLAMEAGIRAVHGSYKTIDYLLLAATTLGDGLGRFVEHFRLINTWLNFELQEDAKGHHVVLASKIGPVPFPAVEITFAVLTERIRLMIGPVWAPTSVSFLHTTQGDPAYYRGFFRCPVAFGAEEAKLTIDAASWEAPIASGDEGLFRVLTNHAELLSADRPIPDDLVARARAEILRVLGNGEPEIEEIADTLAVSARTLQRRLSDRDLTYSRLVDEVREDQGRKLVSGGAMSLSEVAFFLGYSDQSAFTRAFKRWTGQTPREFRLVGA